MLIIPLILAVLLAAPTTTATTAGVLVVSSPSTASLTITATLTHLATLPSITSTHTLFLYPHQHQHQHQHQQPPSPSLLPFGASAPSSISLNPSSDDNTDDSTDDDTTRSLAAQLAHLLATLPPSTTELVFVSPGVLPQHPATASLLATLRARGPFAVVLGLVLDEASAVGPPHATALISFLEWVGPAPLDAWAGYPRWHGALAEPRDVLAGRWSSWGAVTRPALDAIIDTLPHTESRLTAEVDLCARVRTLPGGVVVFQPGAAVLAPRALIQPITAVTDVDTSVLSDPAFMRPVYELPGLTLVWNMECGAGQTLGFTSEAIQFVLALHTRVHTLVHLSSWESCRDELAKVETPAYAAQLILRLGHPDASDPYRLSWGQDPDPPADRALVALVVHRDPGRYSSFVSSSKYALRNSFLYTVGRSMYETNTIPPGWADACNDPDLVQSVWLPSQFNRATFAASGVAPSVLDVVPEAIDTRHFDPARVPSSAHKDCCPDTFDILSVFKWEPRKGWDTLLLAVAQEFTAGEPVRLFLRSGMDEANIAEARDALDALHSPVPVTLLRDPVPAPLLPLLYAGGYDAFVLPSRGEGFGLPMLEALAMAVPVVATNFSGSTQFLDDDVAWLVDYSLVDAPSGAGQWAEPDIPSLRSALRSLYTAWAQARQDPHAPLAAAVRQRTTAAAARAAAHYSHDAIAATVLDRLVAIKDILVQRQAAAAAQPSPPPPPSPSSSSSSSSSSWSSSHHRPSPTPTLPGWTRIRIQ